MNRREALKKLGAGSAVVVGATAVKAVPAFAFNAPTTTVGMSFSLVGYVTEGAVNVGFVFKWITGRATCGASSTSVAPAYNAITDTPGYSPLNRAHLSVQDEVGGTAYEWAAALPADGNSAAYPVNTTTGHTVQVIHSGNNPQEGDLITVYGIVGFKCVYPAPDPDVETTLSLDEFFCVSYLGGVWTVVSCSLP